MSFVVPVALTANILIVNPMVMSPFSLIAFKVFS